MRVFVVEIGEVRLSRSEEHPLISIQKIVREPNMTHIIVCQISAIRFRCNVCRCYYLEI